ncbi:MAG: hypothetical protein IKV97_01840, partial [Clostridia bacterium]|nr:hypothetical protein [Clostridia bacterium]
MKKFVTRILPWILIAAMLVLMLPAVSCRVVNESRNKNVVVSLLYNSVRNSVSSEKLEEVLDKALEIGVNTVSVMEDDVNSLVARGEVTCIKLNVLLHKYDIESMLIAQAITENYPQISYDAFLLLSRRPKTTEKLDRFIGMKYTEDEFFKLEGIEGIDVYAYLNGRDNLWDVSLGYDEAAIAE